MKVIQKPKTEQELVAVQKEPESSTTKKQERPPARTCVNHLCGCNCAC